VTPPSVLFKIIESRKLHHFDANKVIYVKKSTLVKKLLIEAAIENSFCTGYIFKTITISAT